MKETVRLHCIFRRSKVVLEIVVRPLVLARHRAMAGALGHETLDEYFHEQTEDSPVDELLQFVVCPYFAGYTRVEFAQELVEVALGLVSHTPWLGDPTDMPEDEFCQTIEDWVVGITDDKDIREQARAAAASALIPFGSDVARNLKALGSLLAERFAEEAAE